MNERVTRRENSTTLVAPRHIRDIEFPRLARVSLPPSRTKSMRSTSPLFITRHAATKRQVVLMPRTSSMGVNWAAGLIRWKPHIDSCGRIYSLAHLHPFRFACEVQRFRHHPARAVTINVGFGLHVFTCSLANGEPDRRRIWGRSRTPRVRLRKISRLTEPERARAEPSNTGSVFSRRTRTSSPSSSTVHRKATSTVYSSRSAVIVQTATRLL